MPTAAPEQIQQTVEEFLNFIGDDEFGVLPDGVRVESSAITTIQLCETGDDAERCDWGVHGYHVLTIGPLKFNGDRTIAIIEGFIGAPHYLHFVDAMEGTPKMDALSISPDIWDFGLTINTVQSVEDEQGE